MWDNVLGHRKAKAFLENYLHMAKRPHALLFLGDEGIGKRMLALEFARALLCEEGSGCGRCSSCRMLNWEKNIVSHPDFYLVARQADENNSRLKDISIEQIRKLISDSSSGSVRGRGAVCVVDGADYMGVPAANAFLKLLEEPPEGWVIILLAAAENRLLPTILSRTAVLRFRPLTTEAVQKLLLRSAQDLTELQTETLARFSEGAPGLAFSFLQAGVFTARDVALALLSALPFDAPLNYLAGIKYIINKKKVDRDRVLLVISMLQLLLRDLMVIKLGLDEGLYNLDIEAHLEELALGWQLKGLKRSLGFVQEAYSALVASAGARMAFEAMVLQIDQVYKE